MRLYLDDDSIAGLLVRLLRQAGHDVCLPGDVGLAGAQDAEHLTKAVVENRVLLTHNHKDFKILHDLVMTVTGHHPGILVVRKENNPKRDLTKPGIIRAIGKLLASGVPLSDAFHIQLALTT
jgi:predicted nuclease of predicted toxin-antitoxin system